MRPDAFGGMVMLITAGAIKAKSTSEILDDFLTEQNAPRLAQAHILPNGQHIVTAYP